MPYHKVYYRVMGKLMTANVYGDLHVANKKADMVRRRGFTCLIDVKANKAKELP
jgi:hypothetical protein